MAIGPGKYDAIATFVRHETQADAVIIMVVNGKDGSGFTVQSTDGTVRNLPSLLRHIAADIERDTTPN